MKIEFEGNVLFEALAYYVEREHGISIDIESECTVLMTTPVYTPVYLKDSDGNVVLDHLGEEELDPKKRHYVDHQAPVTPMSKITFYGGVKPSKKETT